LLPDRKHILSPVHRHTS